MQYLKCIAVYKLYEAHKIKKAFNELSFSRMQMDNKALLFKFNRNLILLLSFIVYSVRYERNAKLLRK